MNKILVTGGSGMVGNSLKKYIPDAIYISSKDYNLTSETQVSLMFNDIQPDVVIHLAARVGGIMDNINHPAEYFDDNIIMNTLVLKHSYIHNIKRFIGILSTCAYPDIINEYPIPETELHSGPPTKTNLAYGYAKRALSVQINAYNQQYGTKYQYLIPCNLYGEYDKYGDNSHFIAALIKKIHTAKSKNENKILLSGDGTPLRQFMHSDDLAYVIKYCLENNIYDNMNVSVPENLSITEMAEIALKACGIEGIEIEYDITKPNGQYKKDVSTKLLKEKIPSFNPIKLEEGIKQTYNYLIKNNIL
jgi:GDP-L-fucose synthase